MENVNQPLAGLCNGVDVDKLVGAIEGVKSDPANGALVFRTKTIWHGGFRATHTTQRVTVGRDTTEHLINHNINSDEPTTILGADTGISPSEMLIAALGACLSVGYAANAAGMGINIQELSLDIEYIGDLQGFMNLNNVRPGASEIRVKTHIKADTPAAKLKELHDYVNSHSPQWDSIANPVKVRSELIVKSK